MVSNELISELVGELLGEEGINVIFYLKGKEHVSEFKVAKDLKMDIQHARSLLYKLYEYNVVVFERRKDKQKGWYVTYWDFYSENLKHIYRKMQNAKLEQLKQRLKREQDNGFYMCGNACTRMDFDKAIAFNFKCPECGQLMNPLDNKRTIEFINEKIQDLEKELVKA